jgi:hypothetical protein
MDPWRPMRRHVIYPGNFCRRYQMQSDNQGGNTQVNRTTSRGFA